MLKEIEASGFGWVQLPSPPAAVLADPRACIRHARAAASSLAATSLRSVLHAPTDALAGEPASDHAIEGALSYAAECGAEAVVLHARAHLKAPPDTQVCLTTIDSTEFAADRQRSIASSSAP